DLAVFHFALLGLGLNLCRRDALRAERALLHHADFTHRYVRVQLQVERLLPGRVEEIEEANVIRAGVGAISRADAAIVDLRVQARFVMAARVGRADRLAWRRIALLAHHRPVLHFDVGKFALEVTLDTDPMQRAAARGLQLADGRDIVFRVAGGHARFATGAAVEVDRHAPSVRHYRFSNSKGFSRSSPAAEKSTSLPSGSPTRAILTRVAAQASAPVVASATGARMSTGFCPRPDA